MPRRTVAQRHRPSLWAYAKHNFRMSFGMVERTEAMLTIALLVVSAVLATIGSLSAPEISDTLESPNLRVAVGLAIFVVFQFLVFTPARMWRDAVWVTNIEAMLEELWDFHDEGVELLNAHIDYTASTDIDLRLEENTEKRITWLKDWVRADRGWVRRTVTRLEALSPLEARRFRNVVVTKPSIVGVDEIHEHFLGMLTIRLKKLSEVMDRHQPALLPE